MNALVIHGSQYVTEFYVTFAPAMADTNNSSASRQRSSSSSRKRSRMYMDRHGGENKERKECQEVDSVPVLVHASPQSLASHSREDVNTKHCLGGSCSTAYCFQPFTTLLSAVIQKLDNSAQASMSQNFSGFCGAHALSL